MNASVVLDGFPKWVTSLVDGFEITEHEMAVSIRCPKSGYEGAVQKRKDVEVGPDYQKMVVRRAACAIWESRDRHGKLLPC